LNVAGVCHDAAEQVGEMAPGEITPGVHADRDDGGWLRSAQLFCHALTFGRFGLVLTVFSASLFVAEPL
jgi:hypothetical protein